MMRVVSKVMLMFLALLLDQSNVRCLFHGVEDAIYNYAFYATLWLDSQNAHLHPERIWVTCGGTILDKHWILTSYDCLKRGEWEAKVAHVIYAATYRDDPKGRYAMSTEIFRKPNFRPNESIVSNFGLIKIGPDPLELDENAWPASLPTDGHQFKIKAVNVAGVGMDGTDASHFTLPDWTKFRTGYIKTQKYGDACWNYLSENEAQNWLYPIFERYAFCGSDATDSSPCYGDGGGGLIYRYTENWIVVGIMPFVDIDYHCTDRTKPGIYGRMLNEDVDWINKTIYEYEPYDSDKEEE